MSLGGGPYVREICFVRNKFHVRFRIDLLDFGAVQRGPLGFMSRARVILRRGQIQA